MSMRVTTGALLVAGVTGAAVPSAQAQMARTDRAYININGGSQSRDTTFSESFAQELYGEQATYEVTHDIGGDVMFDVGVGARVVSNLAVGVAVSVLRTSSTAELNGTVPHPLFFNRPRSVSHGVESLDHQQVGAHVQFSWYVPVTERVDIALFGGPTFFSVTQQLASVVEIADAEPFANPTVSQLLTSEASGTTVGGHVGVDLSFLFTDNIGAGVMLRFTSGSLDLDTAGGPQSVDVGGMQVAGGLRLRF